MRSDEEEEERCIYTFSLLLPRSRQGQFGKANSRLLIQLSCWSVGDGIGLNVPLHGDSFCLLDCIEGYFRHLNRDIASDLGGKIINNENYMI